METKQRIISNISHLRQLVFEVTNKCNLRCRYCALSNLYISKNDGLGEMLSFDKAKILLDYLFSLRNSFESIGQPLIVSFYGGEPLINIKLIKEIIDYIEKSKYSKVIYGMTSNAVLLDQHIDYLVEKKFQLVISLDGNEHNNSFRINSSGHNSFNKVFKNVVLLQTKYPEYFEKFVQFNSVIHARNSVEDVFNFINSNFNKIPQFSSLNTSGINAKRKNHFNKIYKNVAQDIVASKNYKYLESKLFIQAHRVSILTNYVFKYSGNVYQSYNDLLFNIAENQNKQTGTCSPFAKKMFVTAKGLILSCERIPHRFAFGQIMDGKLNINYDNIAKIQNGLISKLSHQCSKCHFKNNCPLCIYTLDNIDDNNPKCNRFCSESDFEKYEQTTLNFLRDNPEYYKRILTEVTGKF